jgi:hypothetical protein
MPSHIFLSKLRRLQFVGGKVHHFKDQISHEIKKKNHPPFDIFSKLKEILKRFKEKINFRPTLYKVVVKAVSTFVGRYI